MAMPKAGKSLVFFTYSCSVDKFDDILFLFFMSQLKKTVLEFLNNLKIRGLGNE
jgi:hypothetical protein